MSNTKSTWKKITSMRLFMPIVCLLAVLLINVITTPGFFKVSINNGVLYGYIVDVINRASELVILAVGMTLVTAASGGQDISVGAVMAVAAAVCCQILSGGEVSVTKLAAPIALAILAALLASALCGAFNGFLVAEHPAYGGDADPVHGRTRNRPADHGRPDYLCTCRLLQGTGRIYWKMSDTYANLHCDHRNRSYLPAS